MTTDSYFNTTPAAVYRFLDRKEIKARRYRHSRKFIRSLKSKSLREFVKALKYEMIHDPECNESNIPEKVMKRLKIGRATYFRMLKI